MPVIMGRKTYESLNGEPLPGRFNVVITQQANLELPKKVQIAHSLNEALAITGQTSCKEVFIIGGGKVYAESMPVADKIYMTRVHAVVEGDTSFPAINPNEWELESNMDFTADDKHEFAYSFQLWRKKKK